MFAAAVVTATAAYCGLAPATTLTLVGVSVHASLKFFVGYEEDHHGFGEDVIADRSLAPLWLCTLKASITSLLLVVLLRIASVVVVVATTAAATSTTTVAPEA